MTPFERNIELLKGANATSRECDILNEYHELAYETLLIVEDLIDSKASLSYMELGRRLSTIKENLELLSDDSSLVDLESYENIDLEGIREKLNNIMGSIKEFFTSTSSKLIRLSKDSIVWTDNNKKLIDKYSSMLATISNVKKPDITPIEDIGNKLMTMNILKATPDNILEFAKGLTSIGNDKSSMNMIDRSVLGIIPSNGGLSSSRDYIKVTRIDNKKICYIVISDTDNNVGFRRYVDTSLPANVINKYKNTLIPESLLTPAYAKSLLDTAKQINDLIVPTLDTFVAEHKAIEPSLKTDIEDARYKAGPILKNTNKEFLMYAMGGIGIVIGGGLLLSSIPAVLTTAILSAGKVILNVGKEVAVQAKPLVMNKAVLGAGTAAASIGMVTSYDKLIELKDIAFEMLSARDKQIILKNRIRLNSKYTVDGVYGLNNLVSEMIATAAIIISMHERK